MYEVKFIHLFGNNFCQCLALKPDEAKKKKNRGSPKKIREHIQKFSQNLGWAKNSWQKFQLVEVTVFNNMRHAKKWLLAKDTIWVFPKIGVVKPPKSSIKK